MHRRILLTVFVLSGILGLLFPITANGQRPQAAKAPGQTASVSSQPSSWIPTLSARARQVYWQSLHSSHNPRLFTLAGDSNSNPLTYLGRLTNGEFDVKAYPSLQPTVDWFRPSFDHLSLAVGGGFRAADMFDVSKTASADGCVAGEGLFACELRKSNASIVFIQLGTGDKFLWREFETNYRAMLDYALRNNVLPVLVTKADEIESIQGGASEGYINGVIRRLAAEYQLPLMDLWSATRDLPVIPNPNLPTRPYTKFGLQDEWGYYFHLNDIGQTRHVLITLQTLASIRQ